MRNPEGQLLKEFYSYGLRHITFLLSRSTGALFALHPAQAMFPAFSFWKAILLSAIAQQSSQKTAFEAGLLSRKPYYHSISPESAWRGLFSPPGAARQLPGLNWACSAASAIEYRIISFFYSFSHLPPFTICSVD